MRNGSGRVIYDRRFNTAALLAAYYGSNMDFAGRINWNPQVTTATAATSVPPPEVLQLALLACSLL